MPETAVVSLFVTLRRSFAGTPHFHKKVLSALGLSGKLHQCIEKPNNASVRGMLMKVDHLDLLPETEIAPPPPPPSNSWCARSRA